MSGSTVDFAVTWSGIATPTCAQSTPVASAWKGRRRLDFPGGAVRGQLFGAGRRDAAAPTY
jgi:hypothetical protein